MPRSQSYDLAVVGAGNCGLAHALAAARREKRVVVIDRDAQANGASVRNFGFVTVTGQQAGDRWRRAMRSRDVWVEITETAKIPIEQRGLLMVACRPAGLAMKLWPTKIQPRASNSSFMPIMTPRMLSSGGRRRQPNTALPSKSSSPEA